MKLVLWKATTRARCQGKLPTERPCLWLLEMLFLLGDPIAWCPRCGRYEWL